MEIRHNVSVLFMVIAGCALMIIPATAIYTTSDISGNQPLVRGHQFTITITGIPNTAYYVWLTNTWPLSGKPGDQPPLIVDYQSNVQKDPSDGPYPIGSYAYSNGGGRTILDDIAPSSSSMSNTNYYALVTTDSKGQQVVAFQTSVDTALRSYSVRVENPTSVNNESLLVQYGTTTVNRGSVSIEGIATRPTKKITTITTILTPTFTQTPEPTTLILTTAPIPTTTPTPRAAPSMGYSILAFGAGLLAIRKQ